MAAKIIMFNFFIFPFLIRSNNSIFGCKGIHFFLSHQTFPAIYLFKFRISRRDGSVYHEGTVLLLFRGDRGDVISTKRSAWRDLSTLVEMTGRCLDYARDDKGCTLGMTERGSLEVTEGARGMTTKKKRKPHDDFRFLFLSLGNRSKTCPRDLPTAIAWRPSRCCHSN